jgi:hypothetical protein
MTGAIFLFVQTSQEKFFVRVRIWIRKYSDRDRCKNKIKIISTFSGNCRNEIFVIKKYIIKTYLCRRMNYVVMNLSRS